MWCRVKLNGLLRDWSHETFSWALPVEHREKKQLGNILGTDIFPVSLGLDSLSPVIILFLAQAPVVQALQVSHHPGEPQ